MIDGAAGETGWVVVSAVAVPSSNKPGDNPPHADAYARYQEVAPDEVLCTGDDEHSDDPIVFEVSAEGIALISSTGTGGTSEASEAVNAARGGDAPYANHVGFGQR